MSVILLLFENFMIKEDCDVLERGVFVFVGVEFKWDYVLLFVCVCCVRLYVVDVVVVFLIVRVFGEMVFDMGSLFDVL